MKKIWIYILGILTGIVVTFITLVIIAKATNAANNGMTFFDKPGKIMDESSYKVMQTLREGTALANGVSDADMDFYYGLTVLIYNENSEPYYDDQIINAPKGKCFRQIGIYRYPTKMGIEKTVPIVMLMDK